MTDRTDPAEHASLPDAETVLLWIGVLAGPVVALGQEVASYFLVPDACARQTSMFVHAAHLVAIVVIAAGLVVCRRAWARTGRAYPGELPDPTHRAAFLAFGGMVANAFFILIVAGQWLAAFILSPCSA